VYSRILLVAVSFCLFAGCQKFGSPLSWRTWHAKVGWKAGDYFEDPKVIALCDAIEANEVAEMKRLIAAGAHVSGSRVACLTMVFKLMQSASKKWRLLNGSQLLPDVIQGVRFIDGIKSQAAA